MDNLISRQAAIDVLRNRWLKTRNYEGIGEDIAEECEIYLKTLPSAQSSSSCTHENDQDLQSTCNNLATDCISRKAAIDVEGIDEQIRCEMCGNPMHTDRGCDGNCKYDEKLYEKIIQILNKRITPLPSAQPELTDEDMKLIKQLRSYHNGSYAKVIDKLLAVASAQPEIIHCRNCKHWTETCGDKQWGLGDCDVFDKHLVMCNGYCAWAERREE